MVVLQKERANLNFLPHFFPDLTDGASGSVLAFVQHETKPGAGSARLPALTETLHYLSNSSAGFGEESLRVSEKASLAGHTPQRELPKQRQNYSGKYQMV